MPKVSVVITTHNRPTLLPRAIESAFRAAAQAEVVVVDDASTDATSEVCQSFPAVKYVRAERRQGVAGARNLGVLAGTSDYVSFLDDDDVRLPGSLDLQLAALQSAPEAGLVYGRMSVGDESCEPGGETLPLSCPQGDVFWKLLRRNFIPCGSVVFRKSCLSRVGLLDETIPGLDDWDLWVRIAEMYPVIAVNEPVFVWRRAMPRSQHQSGNTPYMVTKGIELLRHRWLSLPRVAPVSPSRRRRFWRRYRAGAIHLLLHEALTQCLPEGEFRRGFKNVSAALRLSPAEVIRSMFHPRTFDFICALFKRKVKVFDASHAGEEGLIHNR
jgi:glycosyltransferase involved in cell wall biosynthesis